MVDETSVIRKTEQRLASRLSDAEKQAQALVESAREKAAKTIAEAQEQYTSILRESMQEKGSQKTTLKPVEKEVAKLKADARTRMNNAVGAVTSFVYSE